MEYILIFFFFVGVGIVKFWFGDGDGEFLVFNFCKRNEFEFESLRGCCCGFVIVGYWKREFEV